MTDPTQVWASGGADEVVQAAMEAARDERATPLERAEMLMELAMMLQRRPKSPEHLLSAVRLYDEALARCPADEALLAARITARKGTALQALPEEGTTALEQARAAYEEALPQLARHGSPEEVAESEMNLGVALQHLAGCGRARTADAIAAYQRALRTFDVRRYPVEYAILQNNLAAAFLALSVDDERAHIRETLAVQCFEEGLKAVNLIDHPSEYAMLQNNLGNALQYAPSGDPMENNVRALAAYEEALRVRMRATTPLEYANTLSNMANCLRTLGKPADAAACYAQALEVFSERGDPAKAQIVAEALADLEHEARASAP